MHGSPSLLTSLALGKVEVWRFSSTDITELKQEIIEDVSLHGLHFERDEGDRLDVPIDFRFNDLLLRASLVPEVALALSPEENGSVLRLPRLLALHVKKTKRRPPEHADPRATTEEHSSPETIWRRNYASLAEHSKKVIGVLEDQDLRGQVPKLEEHEARQHCPNLVVASLGANRKEKPHVSARVLFDGTNGIEVNKRTWIRDQERVPARHRECKAW